MSCAYTHGICHCELTVWWGNFCTLGMDDVSALCFPTDLYHLTGQRDKESAAREQCTEIEKILKEGKRRERERGWDGGERDRGGGGRERERGVGERIQI